MGLDPVVKNLIACQFGTVKENWGGKIWESNKQDIFCLKYSLNNCMEWIINASFLSLS